MICTSRSKRAIDCVGHLVGVEQLDRRRPAEHRVAALVDDAHGAGAELLLELVLAELLGLDRRRAGLRAAAGRRGS